LLAAKGDGQQSGKVDRSAHSLVASSIVRGFIKQYANGAFDPAVTSILEDAFEDAWRRVVANNAPYGQQEYAAAGRVILATHIISAAKAGERDPRWLADSALLYLSQQKLNRTPPNVLPDIGTPNRLRDDLPKP
jgi:hypothetical protein